MDNPALELLGPTRKALVVALKVRGHATAEELGEACYLSPAAARMHLAGMERIGLVAHANKSAGPGRPKNQYLLTPAGDDLFPSGSARLAVGVLNVVSTAPEFAEQVWSVLESRQAETLAGDVHGDKLQDRVHSLVASPRMRKFLPELSETSADTWQVTMRHCPVLSVARAHPVLCEMEGRVFAKTIGEDVTVTILENRAGGDSGCSFRIAANAD